MISIEGAVCVALIRRSHRHPHFILTRLKRVKSISLRHHSKLTTEI
jgi:hypothetical protein